MAIELFTYTSERLIGLLIPEFVFWVFLRRISGGRGGDAFSSRFGSGKFISLWTIGPAVLIIYFFSPAIFEGLFGVASSSWLSSLSDLKSFTFAVFATLFTLLFLVYHMFGKKRDGRFWPIAIIAIICLGVTLFISAVLPSIQ